MWPNFLEVPVDTEKEERVKWKKVGGGTFRMASGKIIKQNQTFWARIDDVPIGFRDTIVPLTELPEEKPLDVVNSEYRIESRGVGWYNILDGQGKVINENALREDKAKELLASLS